MPKPDPAGILHIARAWELEDASGLIMVRIIAGLVMAVEIANKPCRLVIAWMI